MKTIRGDIADNHVDVNGTTLDAFLYNRTKSGPQTESSAFDGLGILPADRLRCRAPKCCKMEIDVPFPNEAAAQRSSRHRILRMPILGRLLRPAHG